MPSISASELSRRIGRSRAAILKLAKRGIVPRLPDGTFEEAAVRRAYDRNVHPAWRKALKGDRSQPAELATVLPSRDDVAVVDSNSLIRRVLAEEGRPVVGVITHEDARTAEEVLRCRKLAMAISDADREYIARLPLQRHIEDALSTLLAEVLAIPDRYSKRVAAELGRPQLEVKAALSKVFTMLAKETDLAALELFRKCQ